MTNIPDPELARQILLDAGIDPANIVVEEKSFGWLVAARGLGAGCTDAKEESFDTPQEVAAHLVKGMVSRNPDQPSQDAEAEDEGSSDDVGEQVHVETVTTWLEFDLNAAKELLRLKVIAESVKRSGLSSDAYDRVNELNAIASNPNSDAQARMDAELELSQHGIWADKAALVEGAKAIKLQEIEALNTPEDVLAYDVGAGWP